MPNLVTAATGETVSFAVSDLSDAQICNLLSTALTQRWGRYAYLGEVNRAQSLLTFNKYGVDADGCQIWGMSQLHQCPFEIGDNYVATLGEAQPVQAVTHYEPIGELVGFSIGVAASGTPTAQFGVTSADRYEKDGMAVYPKSLLFRAGDYPDKKFSMQPSELVAAAAAWTPVSGNVQHTDFLKGRAAFIDKAWTEEDGNVLRGEVKVPLALDVLLTDVEKGISMEWTRAGKFADGFALCTNPRVSDAALMSLDAALTPSTPKTGNKVMTLLDEIKAFFTGKGINLDADAPATPAADTAAFSEAHKAEMTKLRDEAIDARADAFVAAEANRITPAEQASLKADFVQAAKDDAAHPATVSFSAADGTAATGSRLDALKARQSLRPAHNLTSELINGDTKVLLTSGGEGEAATPNPDKIYKDRAAQMGGAKG